MLQLAQYFMHLAIFEIQHIQNLIVLPLLRIPLSFQLPSR